MKTKKIIVFTPLIILLTMSCSDRNVYQKYIKIPDYIWHFENEVSFSVNITDTTSLHDIFLNLRIASMYPYSNIWLKKRIIDEKNEVIFETIQEFILADDRGKWIGEGLGDIIDYQFPINESFQFKAKGTYNFVFSHEMRVENLTAVMDLGLLVKKSKD